MPPESIANKVLTLFVVNRGGTATCSPCGNHNKIKDTGVILYPTIIGGFLSDMI